MEYGVKWVGLETVAALGVFLFFDIVNRFRLRKLLNWGSLFPFPLSFLGYFRLGYWSVCDSPQLQVYVCKRMKGVWAREGLGVGPANIVN